MPKELYYTVRPRRMGRDRLPAKLAFLLAVFLGIATIGAYVALAAALS